MFWQSFRFVLIAVLGIVIVIFASTPLVLKKQLSASTQIVSAVSADIALKPLNDILNKQSTLHSSIKGERTVVAGIPVWKATIDLNDSETILVIASEEEVEGYGGFTPFVQHQNPAFAANTTFKDPSNRNWTMVSQGNVIQGAVSQGWSNGSVIGLKAGNQLEMVDRANGAPWNEYWFALTSSPRLIRGGYACYEGLTGCSSPELDQRPLQRSAIGFSSITKTLYHVVTDEVEGEIDTTKLSEIMKEIGCDEAINLEGGDGVLQAVNGTVYVDDARATGTTVRAPIIVVYNSAHPAPEQIYQAWQRFQATPSS